MSVRCPYCRKWTVVLEDEGSTSNPVVFECVCVWCGGEFEIEVEVRKVEAT